MVEDDALVRVCLGEVLADAGWRVREAADAAEALERICAGETPGVLVTGMMLGRGMSGTALIAAARLLCPQVRTVLVSGTGMADPALDPGDRFLRKPFSVDDLLQAVLELAAEQAVADPAHAVP